ncbi:hypothetical protein ACTXT7_011361 [Hymenolepis weldensis]
MADQKTALSLVGEVKGRQGNYVSSTGDEVSATTHMVTYPEKRHLKSASSIPAKKAMVKQKREENSSSKGSSAHLNSKDEAKLRKPMVKEITKRHKDLTSFIPTKRPAVYREKKIDRNSNKSSESSSEDEGPAKRSRVANKAKSDVMAVVTKKPAVQQQKKEDSSSKDEAPAKKPVVAAAGKSAATAVVTKKPAVQQQKKEDSSSSESSSDSNSEYKSSGVALSSFPGLLPSKRPRFNVSSDSAVCSPPSKNTALDQPSMTDIPLSAVKSCMKRPTDDSLFNRSPIPMKRGRTDNSGYENCRKSLPARLSNGSCDAPAYFNKSSTQSPKVNAPFLRYANRVPESVHFFEGDNFHSRRQLLGEVGERADRNLLGTRGKSFRHEKTKEKRGTRSNGPISTKVASYQFKY